MLELPHVSTVRAGEQLKQHRQARDLQTLPRHQSVVFGSFAFGIMQEIFVLWALIISRRVVRIAIRPRSVPGLWIFGVGSASATVTVTCRNY
jgi:hypothetical protein